MGKQTLRNILITLTILAAAAVICFFLQQSDGSPRAAFVCAGGFVHIPIYRRVRVRDLFRYGVGDRGKLYFHVSLFCL